MQWYFLTKSPLLLLKPKILNIELLETNIAFYTSHRVSCNKCNSGKTSGSRVRFIHSNYSDIILHKPHPNPELKSYQLKQIIIQLNKEGRAFMKNIMKYKGYYGSI